MRKGMVRRWCR